MRIQIRHPFIRRVTRFRYGRVALGPAVAFGRSSRTSRNAIDVGYRIAVGHYPRRRFECVGDRACARSGTTPINCRRASRARTSSRSRRRPIASSNNRQAAKSGPPEPSAYQPLSLCNSHCARRRTCYCHESPLERNEHRACRNTGRARPRTPVAEFGRIRPHLHPLLAKPRTTRELRTPLGALATRIRDR